MPMTYRKLDANGDYTFGLQGKNFYKDQPEAVGQAVQTRLGLIQGEWFLDTQIGTPYNSRILGAGKVATYDLALQEVILNTQGVRGITAYASGVVQEAESAPDARKATVEATIDTDYGQAVIQQPL